MCLQKQIIGLRDKVFWETVDTYWFFAIISYTVIIHSTGSFQGPALTIAFEGAVLSTEEVCSLQTSLPTKLRGQFCQYGTGLLGAYHITELLLIVSSGCLYLFDPPGQVLAASPSDGQASASGGMPVGKAFALKGNVALDYA